MSFNLTKGIHHVTFVGKYKSQFIILYFFDDLYFVLNISDS